MQYKVKKISVSYYPNPQINCAVLLFLDDVDATDEKLAIYTFPFPVDLTELVDKSTDEKNVYIQTKGDELYNGDDVKNVIATIEANQDLTLGLL